MDWIDEKSKQIWIRIKNLSLKKAMTAYFLIFIIVTFVLSIITIDLCGRWINLVWMKYETAPYKSTIYEGITTYRPNFSELSDSDRLLTICLDGIKLWCPYLYAVLSMAFVSSIFYKKRLKIPFEILEKGVDNIKHNNLDFQILYDSKDEMGQLSESFEEMRMELVRNKESMWQLIEEKQRLNAAFAHDLRTPLTVLRGYVDVLTKFTPEGKISQEKLMSTLILMSDHIKRLEQYSNTMKNIHRLEDMPVQKTQTDILQIQEKIKGIVNALNQLDMIIIEITNYLNEPEDIWIDENILLEVLENLLSNAIRYAHKRVTVSLLNCRQDETLNLYVQDDGKGFTNEDLRKALDPYYHESSKEDMTHFGIGLHISNLLCSKHGGTISLANSIEKGAIVSASFCYKEK